jgi:hypothetical protein
MSRPDPIQYAERLYAAIRAANFSPISFLAFGNAVKDGIDLRRMPRIAAEPFMRVVGEMLDLEEEAATGNDIVDAHLTGVSMVPAVPPPASAASESNPDQAAGDVGDTEPIRGDHSPTPSKGA